MLCRLLVISLLSLAQTRWMVGTGMMTWKSRPLKAPLEAPLAAPSLIQGSILNPAARITLGKGNSQSPGSWQGRPVSCSKVDTKEGIQKYGAVKYASAEDGPYDSEESMLSRLMKRGYIKGPVDSRIRIL